MSFPICEKSGRLKRIPKKYKWVFRRLREIGFTYNIIAYYYGINLTTVKHTVEDIDVETLYKGEFRIKVVERETDNVLGIYNSVMEIVKETGVAKQNIYKTMGLNYSNFKYKGVWCYGELQWVDIGKLAKEFENQYDKEHENDFEW